MSFVPQLQTLAPRTVAANADMTLSVICPSDTNGRPYEFHADVTLEGWADGEYAPSVVPTTGAVHTRRPQHPPMSPALS